MLMLVDHLPRRTAAELLPSALLMQVNAVRRLHHTLHPSAIAPRTMSVWCTYLHINTLHCTVSFSIVEYELFSARSLRITLLLMPYEPVFCLVSHIAAG